MSGQGETSQGSDAGAVKACCTQAYSSDLVALLLGDSHHPGGLDLTRRLANALALVPGQHVLDVASGRGSTALLLAREYHLDVDGVDLADSNVALAGGAADAAGVADRVRFHAADAERLPFVDAAFDAAVCECAFCTFPDKSTAARELARVLRPGGRLGLTDVTADRAALPVELTTLGAWVACVADARPVDEYASILAEAGLRVVRTERHDAALLRMIDQIEARLGMLRLTAGEQLKGLGADVDQAPTLLAAARGAVTDGTLGYALLTAQKSS